MSYIIIILILGIAIGIHELGHYLALKKIGVHVHEFAIGFGPKLIHWKSGETEVSIRLLPLGGYVLPATTAEIEEKVLITEGSTIAINEPIKTIDSKQYKIVMTQPYFVKGKNVEDVEPKKRIFFLSAGVMFNLVSGFAVMFIAVLIINFGRILDNPFTGFFDIVWLSLQITGNAIAQFVMFFVGLFSGQNLEYIGSPIGIVSESDNILNPTGEAGIGLIAINTAIVYFSLSINLLIFNLLPIPPLDGYKIVTTTIEMVRGKPVNKKLDAKISNVAFTLLLSLSLVLIMRDIFRLF